MTEQAQLTPKTPQAKISKLKFAYSFLLLDYSLRLLLYGLWRLHMVNNWIFWIGQVLIISILVFFLVAFRLSKAKSKHNIPDSAPLYSADTLLSTIFTVSGLFLGTYIVFTIFHDWSLWVRGVFSVLTFLGYGLYLFAINTASVQIKIKEDGTPVPLQLTVDEWIDENDLEIVRLETDKTSLSQRVDTYTLESTLFGALSFSAFVTIIASEKPVLAGVRELVADFSQVARLILQFEFSQLWQPIAGMATETALIAAIAVETLICSMLFLSVIVSRLRFNDVLKRVDYAVRIASSYNDKEEEVYNFVLQGHDESKVSNRLQILKNKITDAVYHAEESFKDLRPIVNYMWLFRNLGLGSFLLILITGALWISPALAIIFTSLSVLAYVYSALDNWIRTRSLEKRGIVKFFSKKVGLFPVPTRKTNR
jgi:hypothetical protein